MDIKKIMDDMERVRRKHSDITGYGESGAGSVKCHIDIQGRITDLHIKSEFIDNMDEMAVLVIAAFNNARMDMQDKMTELSDDDNEKSIIIFEPFDDDDEEF